MVERSVVLGEGAGGFERRWMEERPAPHEARDAHSLYLETLAELGLVGLALLLVALATPLTAVGRARRAPLGPAALGAFVALLVHAALDWDWELPLLVLCGIACAVALIALARETEPAPIAGARRAASVLALACVMAVALVAHVGNRALSAGQEALARGNLDAAVAHAERARAWAPWSHEPWQLRGEALHAAGLDDAARSSLREAARHAPEDWSVWLDVAEVERGASRSAAVTHARDLNPLSPEVAELVGR
jgi:O-antigen ligase